MGDEFSNSNTIKKYFNYDNSNFINGLKELGFYVSQDSYNGCNSSQTATITTNYMNFDNVVSIEDDNGLKTNLRENNKTKELMNAFDYNIIGVGDSQFIGIQSIISNGNNAAESIDGENLKTIILKNTIVYPFVGDSREDARVILDTVEYFKNPNNYNYEGPTYTASYLCTPHQPFLFGENGEMNSSLQYFDWSTPSLYVNQSKYIEKLILEITESIVKNDPNAVIILQSDHSVRSGATIEEADKQLILNAVYFSGQDISEIDGKSGVDTLRIVFNKIFNLDLKLLGGE